MVIASCDECARGVFFGDVYAGAVIVNEDMPPPPFVVKTYDSKRISPKKRKILSDYIKENCVAWAIGTASSIEIDKYNILKATMMAFHRALDKLEVPFDQIYVDGNRFEPYCGQQDFVPHKCFVKGDDTHDSIGMASILAKVAHDEYIEELCHEHPELNDRYHLMNNMGYGTKKHIDGILQYGFTNYHRKSFKIKQIPLSYYSSFE